MNQQSEAMIPLSIRPLISDLPARRAPAGLRRLKGEDGSGLLEYALVFILFMTMLLGIGAFGLAVFGYHFVSQAARQATRWAAVNGETCTVDNSCNGQYGMNSGPAAASDVQSYVANLVPLGINSQNVTTTVSWLAPANSPAICTQAVNGAGPYANYPGCTVQVQVTYTFNFVFPLVSSAPLTVSSTSEMVIAH
jgi:Flp pilus assembly protein TadG